MRDRAKALPRPGISCRIRACSVFVLLGSLAACEIPTEAPILDTRWAAPVESTRFGVADLLPASVSLTTEGDAFVVDFAPVSFGATLGSLCGPCTLADGFTVPKPAFSDDLGSSVGFPAQVSSVTVEDGSIRIEVYNGFNFDPIRPGGGAFGSLAIALTDAVDGDLLGSYLVDGVDTAFGAGTTLDVMIPLLPVTLDGAIEALLTLDSPAGDPVTVDADAEIGVTASVAGLRVSEVAIDVSGESVALENANLDLDDVGSDLSDRVMAGALLLDVRNPFGVGADFQLSIDGSGFSTIEHDPAIAGDAEESLRIDFTDQEIRDILRSPSVSLSGGAVVDPAAGVVRVRPGQELEIEASLDIEIRIGG